MQKELSDIIKKQEQIIKNYDKMFANLEAENSYLKQELANIKRMLFGKKSERYVPENSAQLSLFDTPVEAEEEAKEEIRYSRKKNKPLKEKGHSRLAIPESLPRQEIIIEPIEDTKGLKKIGEVISEILEYKPGVMYVKKYIRPKYAMPLNEGVVIADMPSLLIQRGNAGPGLLAHLLVSKYVDHLPFHRQRKQLKRIGVDLAESTINDWFKASCRLLQPLYDKLGKKVQSGDYIMADETPMPVQSSPKENSTHKEYQWVYFSSLNKLVYFDYRKSRGREGPVEFFKDFKGSIQSDGYNAYNYFEGDPNIILLACMAHVRRKFEQALDNVPDQASYATSQIQKLYSIERKAKEEEIQIKYYKYGNNIFKNKL